MAQETHDRDWQAERTLLDCELDAALAKYSAAEPRTGLEDRVLATLHTERDRVLTPSRIRWSFVPAAAVFAAIVILVASLAWRTSKAPVPLTAHHSATTAPVVAHSGQPKLRDGAGWNGEQKNDRSQSLRSGEKRVRHQVRILVVANAYPKLEQFPSPQPLSEQEKILQSYVAQYPDRAAKLARERSEMLHRDLQELRFVASGERPTDSEEQDQDITRR